MSGSVGSVLLPNYVSKPTAEDMLGHPQRCRAAAAQHGVRFSGVPVVVRPLLLEATHSNVCVPSGHMGFNELAARLITWSSWRQRPSLRASICLSGILENKTTNPAIPVQLICEPVMAVASL